MSFEHWDFEFVSEFEIRASRLINEVVMNTQEELQEAFNEYNNGTFVKKGNSVVVKY